MNPTEYPTPWMRRVLWQALTAVAITVIFAIGVGFVYIVAWVLAFLQPILVPFAVAGVLAYLLEPVVAWLVKRGTTRMRALIAVFAVTTLAFAGFLVWLIPNISYQTGRLAQKVPDITYKVRLGVAQAAIKVRDSFGVRVLPDEFLHVEPPKPKQPPKSKVSPAVEAAKSPPAVAIESATQGGVGVGATTPPPAVTVKVVPEAANAGTGATPASPGAPATPAATVTETTVTTATKPATPAATDVPPPEQILEKVASGDWVSDALPAVGGTLWNLITKSLGGFLGLFGFLLSLVIVPLYLFYLLAESPKIAASWGKYVPLRASAFKDEVVDCLTEINSYLIAFFRGQLVVSMINGIATGILLAIIGLDFGVLIGFALCFLGIIPYIGIVVCWIPAVIIASVQGGSWFVGADAAWWVFPLFVTGAFAIVQQVDALFVTPKIVGERVGLHPLTVIFSVFLWTLLLGGLLGAILAVPLTAALKVCLKRYVWERTLREQPPGSGPAPLVSP